MAVNTPGERIRQAAEEAARKRQVQQSRIAAEEDHREKRVSDLANRANRVGSELLTRAREILQEAQRIVYLRLERHDTTSMSPGFRLIIGKAPRGGRFIRAQIEDSGEWSMSIYSTTIGQSSGRFHDDASFLQDQNRILEPLLKEAAVAAASGEEEAP